MHPARRDPSRPPPGPAASFLRQPRRGWGVLGSAARAAGPRRKGPGSRPALGEEEEEAAGGGAAPNLASSRVV